MDESRGKVVVNRSMSLDGFVAGPDDDMSWVHGFFRDDPFPEVAAATGAMLVGRRTHDVARAMSAADTEYEGGPVFVLTHQVPEDPDPAVTYLTGELTEALDTAHAAAGGKDVEVLGADLAAQCLRAGLVDEVLVYLLPVLLGDGVRFSPPGAARVELEPFHVSQNGPVTLLRFRVRR